MSYANPANERVACEAAKAVVAKSARWRTQPSCLPEIREFERTSTTALNAYLAARAGQTISGKLEDALASSKFKGSFHIVQSNGGVMKRCHGEEATNPHRAERLLQPG